MSVIGEEVCVFLLDTNEDYRNHAEIGGLLMERPVEPSWSLLVGERHRQY